MNPFKIWHKPLCIYIQVAEVHALCFHNEDCTSKKKKTIFWAHIQRIHDVYTCTQILWINNDALSPSASQPRPSWQIEIREAQRILSCSNMHQQYLFVLCTRHKRTVARQLTINLHTWEIFCIQPFTAGHVAHQYTYARNTTFENLSFFKFITEFKLKPNIDFVTFWVRMWWGWIIVIPQKDTYLMTWLEYHQNTSHATPHYIT